MPGLEFPFFPPPSILIPAAIALLALWWWVYRWTDQVTGSRARRWLTALRIVVTLLLLFCICHPIYREYHKMEQKSTVAILIDGSLSMGIPDLPGGKSRLHRAIELTSASSSGLSHKLGEEFTVKHFAFGNDLRRVDNPSAVTASDQRTCTARALAKLGTALADEPVVAVVMLSDGADNSHENLAPALAAHRQQGAPVYTIPVGTKAGAKDIEITSVTTKRKVSLGTEVTLTVALRGAGAKGLVVPLILEHDDKEVGRQEVELTGEPQVETFVFSPKQEGLLRYKVRLPVQPGEIIQQNNEEEIIVQSSKFKLKVLYMEGTQYKKPERKLWEFDYLVDALERDKDIEVTTLFRDDFQAARKVGIGWVRHPHRGFPRAKRKLYEYDVIVSSDIDIEYFTEKQLKLTVDFIAEHGGGFVMVGGWTAFGPGGYDESVIDKLLPVDMKGRDEEFRRYDTDRPVNWTLTEEGLRHPIMRLTADPDKNAKIWDAMPPFYGFNYVQRAKPAATVLARTTAKYGDRVMLAVQQYGRGRAMAFLPDTTAGWGEAFEGWGETENVFMEPEHNVHFRQFWQNAVRWLGAYQMQAPNKHILVHTRLNRYTLGDEAEILAEVRDEDFELTFEATASAEIRTPAGTIDTVRLEPDLRQKGLYVARYELKDEGRYEVTGNSHVGDKEVDPDRIQDKTAFFCDQSQAEFRNYAVHEDLLKRVADATGGRVLSPDQIDGLVDELQEATHQAETFTSKCFWDNPYLYGLILLLYAIEWFTRRRVGLL